MRTHLRGLAATAATAIMLVTTAGMASADEETATVTGRIWFDRDSDQVQDAGEPGFPASNSVLWSDEADGGGYVSTDADGDFTLADLKPGTYRLGNWNYNVYSPTTEQSATVTVAAGETATVQFGIQGAMLNGGVFVDNEGDGQVGPNERPLAGVAVRMIGPAGLTGATTTGADGGYVFQDLPRGGNYQLVGPDLTARGLVPMARTTGQDMNPDYRTDRMVLERGEYRVVNLGYAEKAAPTTTTKPPAPTTTAPAVKPVANKATGSGQPPLANTGVSPIVPIALGVVLLAAGGTALVASRRRASE